MSPQEASTKETTPKVLRDLIDFVGREEAPRLAFPLRPFVSKGACAFYVAAYREYEGMLRSPEEISFCLTRAYRLCRDFVNERGKMDKAIFKAALLGAYRMAVETEKLIQ